MAILIKILKINSDTGAPTQYHWERDSHLLSGFILFMPQSKDITGLKFNRLTAIKFVEKVKNRIEVWLFRCDCGKELTMRKPYITSGAVKSCGCYRLEQVSKAIKTHGLTRHPLWSVWMGVKARCYNPNSHEYKRYGGIGVVMCDEWLNDFKRFYDWCMENGWAKGMHIDKDILSKKKGLKTPIYSPATCCIITPKENSNNTKWNRNIEYEGFTRTIAEWAEVTGIPGNTILYRLRYGWDVKSALTISTKRTGKKKCFH